MALQFANYYQFGLLCIIFILIYNKNSFISFFEHLLEPKRLGLVHYHFGLPKRNYFSKSFMCNAPHVFYIKASLCNSTKMD